MAEHLTATRVFVTGRPAAGKSRTIDRISAALDTLAVVLDSDVLRQNHPAMPEIMAQDPQRMDVLSNGPVGYRMSGAIEHCRELRYNTIIENALTNPTQVSETARSFRDAGFTVMIAALAVHEKVSRLGIITRYLAGVGTDALPGGQRTICRQSPVSWTPALSPHSPGRCTPTSSQTPIASSPVEIHRSFRRNTIS